ncbi:MAG TPA: hypothetical protein VHP33_36135 [Polyangiaceae bacterium]|nr:hypothetical protein [Polyangiaceae bacterium]
MNRVLVVAALTAFGCASRDEGGEHKAAVPSTPAVEPSETRIGSACVAEDGWQPGDGLGDSVGGEPAAIAPPDGYVDTPDLPPGILYCLSPGGVFPDGYLTSNCSRHSDCPPGTRCDDVHCRLPCESDELCRSPSVCGAPAGVLQVRFCSCTDCVLHPER